MKEVLVSFPLTGRKGKDVKKKGESNLLDICSMIAFSSDNGRDDYLKSIRQNASSGDRKSMNCWSTQTGKNWWKRT